MYVCMYVCMYVLGGACLIERVKRWLASCGEDCESRVDKLERPSAGRTRNLRVFFFFLLLVRRRAQRASEGQRSTGTQENTDRSRRHSAQNVRTSSEKSTKNRSKIDEHPCQIDQKSMKKSISGRFGRPRPIGDASGRARDGSWTAKWRPKTDLEAPQAGQEWPRDVQNCPRAALRTLPDRI